MGVAGFGTTTIKSLVLDMEEVEMPVRHSSGDVR